MRVLITLPILLSLLQACDLHPAADDGPHLSVEQTHQLLQGTWQQVLPQDEAHQSMTSLKFFIGNRMAFVSYSEVPQTLIGATGGTFSLDGSSLNEVLEYDATDNGTVGAHFTYRYDLHGDTLVLSKDASMKFQEKYVKLEDSYSGVNPMEGAWEMSLCRYGNAKELTKNAEGINAIKILTPNRFMVVHFDVPHKHFVGISGGAYTHFEDTYVEHIHYNSRDASAIGETAEFSYALSESTLHKKGYIDSEKFPSLYIEEIFERIPLE